MASGFGSIRRFNFVFQHLYGRTPTDLRRLAGKRVRCDTGILPLAPAVPASLRLGSDLGFLADRAIPCVESVTRNSYRRTINSTAQPARSKYDPVAAPLTPRRLSRCSGTLPHRGTDTTALRSFGRPGPNRSSPCPGSAARAEACASSRIAASRRVVAVRIGGASVLGQQISVKGASTIADRIAARYGNGGLFPSAEVLATADIEDAGYVRRRAATIRALAAAVWNGSTSATRIAFLETLLALPGVGPWTAQYIAMRAFGEPDAFPAGDLVLQRAAGCRNARELEERAEAWRPWRAYAAIHLWQGVKDEASLH